MSKFTPEELQLINECVLCEVDEQESMLADFLEEGNNSSAAVCVTEIIMLSSAIESLKRGEGITDIQQNSLVELVISWLIYYVINPVEDVNNPTLATALEKLIG